MAIQHRRGIYDNFDPDQMRAGEWAVVLSGDAMAPDGMACYMCFAAGVVKRMATFEDMVANIASADAVIVEQLTQGVESVEDAIEAAEALRVTAEAVRATAESARAAAETARATAETARATAETGRSEAETERELRFAEIEQIAQGWTIHHCTSSEYDATTRKPTVSDPDPGTLYCVPGENGDSDWVEWRYDTVSQDYETVGSTSANTSPISTSTIDSIVSDVSETGTDVLQTTGLTYLWTKLKAKFAALTHYHLSLGDSTSTVLQVDTAHRSVIEGLSSYNTAGGMYAHAEGYYTDAPNLAAHAEGGFTTAGSNYSHVQGVGNSAAGEASHVAGKYALLMQEDMAEVIGNGTSAAIADRSNARTLDWDGNAWHAGEVSATEHVSGGSDVAHNLTEKADQADVDTALAGKAATVHDHSGQAITPASVAATGDVTAVKNGTTYSLGTLGESVSRFTLGGLTGIGFSYNANSGTYSIHGTTSDGIVVSLQIRSTDLRYVKDGNVVWSITP